MATTEKPVLKLTQLTKRYGQYRGVEDVSLQVASGSIFGFLGPNGAGKTTTISMMMGLLSPTSGSIELFGKDNQQSAVETRGHIGYLAGDMALDGSLTGWQELEYFSRLRGDFNKVYISELAERLQADLTRKIKTLSRGNRQKIGLIASLMHKPKLLILDEPTSGLDPLVQAQFNEIIIDHKKAGRSAFISSHVLSEVQQICDRVGFIKEGRLIAEASLNELFKSAPKQVQCLIKGKLLIDLSKIPGVMHVHADGKKLSFTFGGNISQLLKTLSFQPLADISINDADLEVLFMNYYKPEADHA